MIKFIVEVGCDDAGISRNLAKKILIVLY